MRPATRVVNGFSHFHIFEFHACVRYSAVGQRQERAAETLLRLCRKSSAFPVYNILDDFRDAFLLGYIDTCYWNRGSTCLREKASSMANRLHGVAGRVCNFLVSGLRYWDWEERGA